MKSLNAGRYDLITAACAVRVLANPPAHYAPPDKFAGPSTLAGRYRNLFALAFRSLAPGGCVLCWHCCTL